MNDGWQQTIALIDNQVAALLSMRQLWNCCHMSTIHITSVLRRIHAVDRHSFARPRDIT